MIKDARLSGRSVLVVDDDAAIRGVVRQALEAEGWRVLEAGDGAAALTVYENAAPRVALVLIDLTMPVMSGAQFAEQYWRAEGRATAGAAPSGHAPLVVFTASRGMEAAVQAERLHAVGFVTKPFELDELLAVVERCARRAGSGAGHEVPNVASRLPSSPGSQGSMVAAAESDSTEMTEGTMTVGTAGIGSRVTAKLSREEQERQRQMDRLRAQLLRLQQDMGKVRLGVSEVTQIEMARRLTREEARRASLLRMESERLRYELQLIRDEFFRIKEERPTR